MKFKVVKRCQEDLSSIHGLLKSFLPFARKRMGFNKPPTIFFKSDQGNAQKLLGKTAHYEPATGHITVYVTGRHPKDVLRSLSHELVHHGQNCRGEFGHTPDTAPGYAQTDSHMRKMEEEAYSVGNLCFRDWEDSVKSGRIQISMPLKESLIREQEEHTTVDGDTLSGIAQKEYGDSHMWPIIYLANKSQIGGDPDLISPGMTFIIPDASEFSKLSKDEINSIYGLSSFYTKSGSDMVPTGGSRQGPALSVEETDALFPVRKESRPSKISPYGMRGPIVSLAAKHNPDGSGTFTDSNGITHNMKRGDTAQPNRTRFRRYSQSSMHYGIDLGLTVGTDIIAPVSGKIKSVSPDPKNKTLGGNIMVLKGNDNRIYKFMHLSSFIASRGDEVEKGQVIAKSGKSGSGTGPHLHFEVLENGKHIDPMTLYSGGSIQSITEWKNEELNKLLLEKFNLGVTK